MRKPTLRVVTSTKDPKPHFHINGTSTYVLSQKKNINQISTHPKRVQLTLKHPPSTLSTHLKSTPPYKHLHLHIHTPRSLDTHLLPHPFIITSLERVKEKALQLYVAAQKTSSALHLLEAHLAKQG